MAWVSLNVRAKKPYKLQSKITAVKSFCKHSDKLVSWWKSSGVSQTDALRQPCCKEVRAACNWVGTRHVRPPNFFINGMRSLHDMFCGWLES